MVLAEGAGWSDSRVVTELGSVVDHVVGGLGRSVSLGENHDGVLARLQPLLERGTPDRHVTHVDGVVATPGLVSGYSGQPLSALLPWRL